MTGAALLAGCAGVCAGAVAAIFGALFFRGLPLAVAFVVCTDDEDEARFLPAAGVTIFGAIAVVAAGRLTDFTFSAGGATGAGLRALLEAALVECVATLVVAVFAVVADFFVVNL